MPSSECDITLRVRSADIVIVITIEATTTNLSSMNIFRPINLELPRLTDIFATHGSLFLVEATVDVQLEDLILF
jgi:hypothetical protein